jgi:hypothetical protein
VVGNVANALFKALIEETEAILEKWKHPDPYRPPTAPGGSKYERNLAPPTTERESVWQVLRAMIC